MAFNTVGGLLRFVSPFQLRLNSDNSDRPFLQERLVRTYVSAERSTATLIFTEGNPIQSKMKIEGRNAVLHKVSTIWTSTGLGGNHPIRKYIQRNILARSRDHCCSENATLH